MRRVLTAVGLVAILAALGGAACLYAGIYDVGATAPHWQATRWVLEQARLRSIRVHAAGLMPPADFGDPARIAAGSAHFSEHCALCHSAPGVDAQDLAEGMAPKPPDLSEVSKRYSPGELFWIVRNGIRMTGMPAWADHGDDDLWSIVAFLEKLAAPSPPPKEGPG